MTIAVNIGPEQCMSVGAEVTYSGHKIGTVKKYDENTGIATIVVKPEYEYTITQAMSKPSPAIASRFNV